MASKVDSVNEVIDKYTKNQLDTFIVVKLKEMAKENIDSGKTSLEVADVLYDYLYNNFSGDEFAASSLHAFPKNVMLIMRSDIINCYK